MNDQAAVYARVSTDEQAERQTIENQLEACRGYCASRGLEVVAEFRDEGVSGGVPLDDRPEGSRLLAMAGSGLFSRVVVHRLDRLARDHVEASLAYRKLKALGTPVVSVTETFDDSPTGRLMFNMIVSFAEFEKDLIRERTMMGRARRVRNGKYQASTAPFGYKYDPVAGQLTPHPDNAEVVRQMFRWAAEGLGLKAIASRLEDIGVPSPGVGDRKSNWGWHQSTVYKILKAPRYIGRNTYGGEPMTCPALVDEETFWVVQEMLTRRRRNSPRNTKRFYLLQHLIYCRACGGRYMARTVAQRNGPVGIYACRRRAVYGRKAGHEGIHWRWHAEELEVPIKRHILKTYADPEYMLREAQIYEERGERATQEWKGQESGLQARLDDLVQDQRRIVRLARKGLIDETQMQEQLEEIRSERGEIEEELDALRQRPVDAVKLARWAALIRDTVGAIGRTKELIPDADWEDDSWTDDVLTGGMMAFRGADEIWPACVEEVVDRIWVENDGSITIEGMLPGCYTSEGRTPKFPRSR